MMVVLAVFFWVVEASTVDLPMNFEGYLPNWSRWTSAPVVVICTDMTDFTVQQVQDALAVWPKSQYTSIVTAENCNYDIQRGMIKIVDGAYIQADEWAYTKYLYQDLEIQGHQGKLFKGAVVQLDRSVHDISLLIHELGHAYGYQHYDAKIDVMNTYMRF